MSLSLNTEAKKLSSPTRKNTKGFVGIKDALATIQKGQIDESLEQFDNQARKPFSIDELRMNWTKFAFIAKEKGLETLHNAMVASDPTLGENYAVNYTINNEIQLGFIKNNETDIVNYLRTELNNWGIHLNLKEEIVKGEVEAHTSQAKFEKMKERNPIIEELRKKFHLDLDI